MHDARCRGAGRLLSLLLITVYAGLAYVAYQAIEPWARDRIAASCTSWGEERDLRFDRYEPSRTERRRQTNRRIQIPDACWFTEADGSPRYALLSEVGGTTSLMSFLTGTTLIGVLVLGPIGLLVVYLFVAGAVQRILRR
jgi:hypothetical protein